MVVGHPTSQALVESGRALEILRCLRQVLIFEMSSGTLPLVGVPFAHAVARPSQDPPTSMSVQEDAHEGARHLDRVPQPALSAPADVLQQSHERPRTGGQGPALVAAPRAKPRLV
jgi:hypothetical protein